MPLYWLVYRHDDQISGAMASPGSIHMAACGAASPDYVFDGPAIIRYRLVRTKRVKLLVYSSSRMLNA
jgi:hypothetical protein